MRNTPTRLNGTYTNIQSWNSPTGASLCVYYKKAKGRAKAVIHINHGLADHAGRYARFSQKLSAAGFHVYAQDHRGHGATTAPDAEQGIFAVKNGWNMVLDDMKYVNSQIREKHKKIPIILFGHSMGAMLGYNYLLRWPETIDGAAIWNAAISKTPALGQLKFVLGVEKIFKGLTKPSIINKLTFETFNNNFAPNTTKSDWLSKDVSECQEYDDDPDCGWPASVSMWRDMAQGITYGSSDQGLGNVPKDMPIYLLGGDADPSVEKGKTTLDLDTRLIAAQLTHVKTEIRKNGRHEALNEPKDERDAVMQDFVDWVNSVI